MAKLNAPSRGAVPALVLAALAFAGCGGNEEAPAPPSPAPTTEATSMTAPAPVVQGVPGPVRETRAAIIAAVAAKDYDLLVPLVEAEIFLSDFGFGVDPVRRWRALGPEPLEVMGALLGMRSAPARETNEGTLYQWPRFTPDSDPSEMSRAERETLLTILSEAELEAAFLDETGYTGPRLGILADGVWWFFVQESGP